MLSNCNTEEEIGIHIEREKCERIYDDFHPQVVDNPENPIGYHRKQPVERKFRKSEELVRYMSCLPSYLERGENPQEKPFNTEVLDWRLPQKWQHKNNDVGINSEHSPSTSNATSFISSKGSSTYCSSDNTRSRHQQKIRYPSVPTEGCSSGTKLFAGNAKEFLDRRNASIDLLRAHHSSLQATQSSQLDTVNRVNDSKSEDHKVTRSQPLETDGILFVLKGNDMIQNGEASKAKEQVPCSAVAGSRHFAVGHQSDSSKGDNSRLLEEDWYAFYGEHSEKASFTKSRSDRTCFYSIASECGKTRDSNVHKSFAKEMRSSTACLAKNRECNSLKVYQSVPPEGRIWEITQVQSREI